MKIGHVWGWSGFSFPESSTLLSPVTLVGIGGTGPGFQNHFWLEFSYIIKVVGAIKVRDPTERRSIVGEPWVFAEFLDAQDQAKSRQLRHMLCHLLFPESFERISSRSQKRAILLAFATPEEKSSVDLSDRQSIDRTLLSIRKRLEVQYGTGYDYYENKELLELWLPKADEAGGADDADGTIVPSLAAKKSISIPIPYSNGRFWLMGAGHRARYWDLFFTRKTIAIGFDEFGSELPTLDDQAIFDKLSASRSDGIKPWNDALAAQEFVHAMKPGDFVFVKKGRSVILGFGKITSEYRYDPDFPFYHHLRDVEWIKTGNWKLEEGQSVTTKTLTEFTEYREWLAYALVLIGAAAASGGANAVAESAIGYAAGESAEPYVQADALEGAFIDETILSSIMRAWEGKKNLILTGAPGTGKSWLARRLAWLKLGAKDESRLLALQFHQSYSYEDFVRGWRPGKGQFELVDGPFLEFCNKARMDSDRPYVLLIDEINRGNLSRIFGELLSLLEADKRRKEYAIRLGNMRENEPPFHVPDNIYLLGTMNSADRSLAVVDYALRRRFAFRELKPAFERDEFANFLVEKEVDQKVISRIVDSMGKLNEAIAGDRNLGPGYRIGHSFFALIDDEAPADDAWYETIVRGEILPLLEEYWFDEPAKVQEWKPG